MQGQWGMLMLQVFIGESWFFIYVDVHLWNQIFAVLRSLNVLETFHSPKSGQCRPLVVHISRA